VSTPTAASGRGNGAGVLSQLCVPHDDDQWAKDLELRLTKRGSTSWTRKARSIPVGLPCPDHQYRLQSGPVGTRRWIWVGGGQPDLQRLRVTPSQPGFLLTPANRAIRSAAAQLGGTLALDGKH